MNSEIPSCHLASLMLKRIKLESLEFFEGKHNGKFIKESIVAIKTYFYLVGLKNDSIRGTICQNIFDKANNKMI